MTRTNIRTAVQHIALLCCLALLLIACDNGSGSPGNPMTGPAAPSAPTVSTVSTNQVNLSWTEVSGADSYEIWRGTAADGSDRSRIAESTNAMYSDSGLSIRATHYYWLKACNDSGCSDFSGRIAAFAGAFWTEITGTAAWSGRSEHTSVVFKDKLWMLGGFTGSNDLKDIWSSSDGITWTLKTNSAAWPARSEHTSVVFKDKLWVLGGTDGSSRFNDVWHSTDGITWTMATGTAAWSERSEHTSVVFDNKLWVIGGSDVSSRFNDVWHSSDGITWEKVKDNNNAGWSRRSAHTSVVFKDKLWVLGGAANDLGNRFNDVWHSSDGITWEKVKDNNNAGWSGRSAHTSVVFKDKLWVLGGAANAFGNRFNDVWSSTDGITWTMATGTAAWSARNSHTSVVFDNKLWVLGGSDSNRLNDVWSSE